MFTGERLEDGISNGNICPVCESFLESEIFEEVGGGYIRIREYCPECGYSNYYWEHPENG